MTKEQRSIAGTPTTARGSWLILAVLCLSELLVTVDNTIVNVALPSIGRALGTSTSALQWVVDAYALVFAGLLLLGGSLGDRLGRRRMLQAGMAGFALASVGAAFAQTSGQLIAARGAMGAAAALVYPATLALVTSVFTDAKQRATAIGIWAGVSGLAIAIGPLAGGLLLAHFAWHSVFWFGVVLALIALGLNARILPESRDATAGRFDPLGAALSIAAMLLLVQTVIEAPGRGWSSLATIVGFAVSAFLIAAFVGWELRRTDPLLDVRIFRNARFSAASGAIALAFFGLFGFIFLITLYFQAIRGYSPLRAGCATLPFAAITGALSPVAIVAMKRIGTKLVVAGGLILMSGGFVVAAGVDMQSAYWGRVIVAMALMAAGLAFTTSPATEAIMGALPVGKAGAGSAVNDTTRELGGALGVAVLGSVLTSRYAPEVTSGLSGLGITGHPAQAASHSLIDGLGVSTGLPATMQGPASAVVRSAFIDGLGAGSFVAAAATALAAIAALMFLPARGESHPDDEASSRAAVPPLDESSTAGGPEHLPRAAVTTRVAGGITSECA